MVVRPGLDRRPPAVSDALSFVQTGYAHAAEGWARGAELAYVPMAAALLDAAPVALRGSTILDVGTGTGAVARLAGVAGAVPIGLDASFPMLAYGAADRPPAAVADVNRLPLFDGAVDIAAAAFVLNHLTDPVAALTELGRVVRPGGAVLATVFSTADRPPAKAAIDGALAEVGWQPPDWYRYIKSVDEQLGSAAAMSAAAGRAGFESIEVSEIVVDTRITDPAAIVEFRLSQPHVLSFLSQLDPRVRERVRLECVDAVASTGVGLNLGVVMLVAVPTESGR